MAVTIELYHTQVNSVHISTPYSSRHNLMLLFPIYNKFPKGFQIKFCIYFSSFLYTLHALLTISFLVCITLISGEAAYKCKIGIQLENLHLYCTNSFTHIRSNKMQLHTCFTRPSPSPYLDYLGRFHRFSTLQQKKGGPCNVTQIKKAT
jgi:hypothetical protein